MNQRYLRLFSHIVPFLLAGVLASCATRTGLTPLPQFQPVPGSGASEQPNDDVSYWDGDGISGAPKIVIRQNEQKAYFYKGDHLVGISRIASGKEGHRTPNGNFHIIRKDRFHKSALYGWLLDSTGNVVNYDADSRKDRPPHGGRFDGAEMFYFMEITPGIGMHKGPIPRPGQTESHGCIRMPEFMAAAFWENTSIGTPVTVMP